MSGSELAGKPAPRELLANVPRLVSLYYEIEPDPSRARQRVAFGTSGHRGTSAEGSFNEDHILATSQAICDYRREQGIDGPLYMGMDTHALSEPAFNTALEVFAANGVTTCIQAGRTFTPTPAISHAILTHNRAHPGSQADGVVITPSHNPPEDGGFKYNPPSAGPADTSTTRDIQARANAIHGGRAARREAHAAGAGAAGGLRGALRLRDARMWSRWPRSWTWMRLRVRACAWARTPWAARAWAIGRRLWSGTAWT